MSEISWNKDQLSAIEARGGSLLVSAAAGSGKTAVLVERAIRRIAKDDNPIDANRLLIVTFTKAAAAEMRSRIRKALSALIEKDPQNRRLARQELLLERSHIGTIHSFCGELIKSHFEELEISPGARIADEAEAKILQREVASKVIEEAYESTPYDEDVDFANFINTLGAGRNDNSLTDALLSVYNSLRSKPDYLKLKNKFCAYCVNDTDNIDNTPWGEFLLFYFKEVFYDMSLLSFGLMDAIGRDKLLEEAYYQVLKEDNSILLKLRDKCDEGWNALFNEIRQISFSRMPTVRGKSDDPLKAQVVSIRKKYTDTVKKIGKKYIYFPAEDCKDDMLNTYSSLSYFCDMLESFDEAYTYAKEEQEILDYSDLEQLSHRLLIIKDGKGDIHRTPVAKELSLEFDEIMVDEYQDVNEVQEDIFNAISKNGENLFLVGDVKQSIYRFREAVPRLFLDKKEKWPRYDGKNFPATIILGSNYRSRKDIAGAVNFIFTNIMSHRVGGMEYRQEDMLIAAAPYPDCSEPMNELVLIESPEGNATENEARTIALKIKEMVKSGITVMEKGVPRPVKYSDFAVLLRSVKGKVSTFLREFFSAGIPCKSEHGGGFLTLPEIVAVIDMLRFVDNPFSDIPLAGAMLSELFMFTPTELAKIRLNDRNGRLFHALTLAYEKGDEKAGHFLNVANTLRMAAAEMDAEGVIEELYKETNLPNILRVGEGGDIRLANLRLLKQYARNFSKAGIGGLSGFLRFIDKLQSREQDLAPAGGAGKVGNSVHIMSVHGSKGLEFPIVILGDTAHRFNFDTASTLPMVDRDLGIAYPLKLYNTNVRYPSFMLNALRLNEKYESLSEELRILYVAMTRAKERLIITGTVKDAEKYILDLADDLVDYYEIAPNVVANSKCFLDWIVINLLIHPSGEKLREYANGKYLPLLIDDDTPWKINITAPTLAEEIEERECALPAPSERIGKLLRERSGWVYPHKEAEHIPAKLGVSDMVHKKDREQSLDEHPSFGVMTGAERGSALHTFMQFANFTNAKKDAKAEIARLLALEFITQKQGEVIDPEKVKAFFDSQLFKRIECSPTLYREYRFMEKIPADKLGFLESGDENVVVQGVADCLFEEGESFTVLDYKTDRVKEPSELIERYAPQLLLYKELLSKHLPKRVKKAVIWSFALGMEIEIS